MKTAWIAVAASLALALARDASAAPASAQDLAALKLVNQAFADALSAGDASKLGDLYTEDALLMPPNAPPTRGRAAAVAYFENLLKAGKVTLQVRSGTAGADGDLGYDAGQYAFELAPAQGSPNRDDGKYLLVLRRGKDARWRIAVDTWSSDLAAR